MKLNKLDNHYNIASFLYASIDPETLLLAKELEELGGGNVKVNNLQLHGIINHSTGSSYKSSKHQTLWNYGESIGLRDIYQPIDTPASESMKYYPTNTCHNLDNLIKDDINSFYGNSLIDNDMESNLNNICNEVSQGFNHCVITYGASTTGKTTTLFGSEASSNSSQPHFSGIIGRILNKLYTNSDDRNIVMGISSWIIYGDKVIE